MLTITLSATTKGYELSLSSSHPTTLLEGHPESSKSRISHNKFKGQIQELS